MSDQGGYQSEPTPQSDVVAVVNRHHPESTNARGVVLFFISLGVFMAACHLALVGIYSAFRVSWPAGYAYPDAIQAQRKLPPEPRLQVDPAGDWQNFVAAEVRELNSYGWVDRKQQLAHVPIDVAIRMLADQQKQQGGGATAAPAFDPSRERAARYDSSGGLSAAERRSAALPWPRKGGEPKRPEPAPPTGASEPPVPALQRESELPGARQTQPRGGVAEPHEPPPGREGSR